MRATITQSWIGILGMLMIVSTFFSMPLSHAEDSGTPKIGASSTTEQLVVKRVTGTLALQHPINVEIDHLAEYLNTEGKDPSQFVLYLNNRPLKGMVSLWEKGTNVLSFDVQSTSDSKKHWDALLNRPFSKEKGFAYPVKVSVGYGNEQEVPSNVKHPLVIIHKTGFWIFVIFFAVVIFCLFKLAKTSGILRDRTDRSPEGKLGTYSLGRIQMAWWFVLISMSYVYLWMLTYDRNTLSESATWLLGISTTTGFGAVLVSINKKNDDHFEQEKLEQEAKGLTAALQELATQIEASASPQATAQLKDLETRKRLQKEHVNQKLAKLKEISSFKESKSFWKEILSDATGVTLHRFQMVVWTVVLSFIFLRDVYVNVAMPEFSGTLLALMGISGGTYIGFKFPEKSVK